MFIYWDGFEIDGSDTDFNIVLPENVQVWEFVECFLSIPIFSNVPKPYITYKKPDYSNPRYYELQDYDFVELKEKLFAGNYSDIGVTVFCCNVDQLSNDIRARVYAISERREPHESAYGKAENPCTSPIIPRNYERGGTTVELLVQQSGTEHGITDDDEYGYVHNFELFRSADQRLPSFQINVGPGFYFEYAIFIIDYLRDHFPGIGVCGGLDCSGGWTDGCTYACSIHYLEKILLPVKHSTRNTVKRLTEYDIVRSYEYTNKGWNWEYINEFYLADSPREGDKPLSFAEYLELVDMALGLDADPFSIVCETAIRIALPPVGEYAENPEAFKALQAALPDSENVNRTGYFAFTKIDGNPMIEFRVPYTMKEYLLTLLELAESGAIDFIKPVTWQRRQK